MIESEMIEIPEGQFSMGTDGANPEERPQHEVYLHRFEIAKYPVTNQQYELYISHNPDLPTLPHWIGRTAPTDRINHPAVQITWHEALAYTTWFSHQTGQTYRFPTEAEWENAARGTDGRAYPWGTDFDASKCNTRGNGPRTTTSVDHYPDGTSFYGVMDMAGNAGEWCVDWYQEGYPSTPQRDPIGPSMGEHRVVRGGSWRYSADAARCSARYWCPPDLKRDNTGLRLARSR